MEGLKFEMMDDDAVGALFIDDEKSDNTSDSTEKDSEEKDTKTAEVDVDKLFDDSPKSVGSENNKEDEEDTSSEEDGTSPEFFSSMAKALAEEDIFPDLDDETIGNIKTASDLRTAVEEQMKAGLDAQQKRIINALDNNVQPDVIKQYENILYSLNNISEATLSTENKEGEELRKRLLYQDFINKGFSRERAEKAVMRAVDNGTDIEDAIEALESNKEFYNQQYQGILEQAKIQKQKEAQELKKRAEKFKKSILENEFDFLKGIDLNKRIRQEAFNAVTKPIYKDPETGEMYTAIQKLELDNSEEFLAKLGFLYTLTDGFKNLNGLINDKVKKEVKKGFSELQNKINTTRRDSSGNLNFASGVDDKNSYFGKGIRLDL